MAPSRTLVIGMAVHQDTIAVAYVAHDHGAEVIYLGTIGTRQGAIDQLLRHMQAKAQHLIGVSAAGPCGSWLDRYLTKKDDDCWGVAPSLRPQKARERVKTDRRDTGPLARLARSGALTPVYGPKGAEEAIRDLTRARADALSALKDTTCRLHAFFLRHAIRSPGHAKGGPPHLRWLSEVVCPTPAQPIVFHEEIRAVPEQAEGLQRLAPARHEQGTRWRLQPVVEALQALRGGPCTVASTMLAAVGALTRFEPPRELRTVLGLIPAAYASGARRRQGSITKAGHTQARRALVEGAWTSRYPATVRRHLQLRLERVAQPSQKSSGQAQRRRGKRDRPLSARGQHAPQVVVAIARALRALLWAMAQEVSLTPSREAMASAATVYTRF